MAATNGGRSRPVERFEVANASTKILDFHEEHVNDAVHDLVRALADGGDTTRELLSLVATLAEFVEFSIGVVDDDRPINHGGTRRCMKAAATLAGHIHTLVQLAHRTRNDSDPYGLDNALEHLPADLGDVLVTVSGLRDE